MGAILPSTALHQPTSLTPPSPTKLPLPYNGGGSRCSAPSQGPGSAALPKQVPPPRLPCSWRHRRGRGRGDSLLGSWLGFHGVPASFPQPPGKDRQTRSHGHSHPCDPFSAQGPPSPDPTQCPPGAASPGLVLPVAQLVQAGRRKKVTRRETSFLLVATEGPRLDATSRPRSKGQGLTRMLSYKKEGAQHPGSPVSGAAHSHWRKNDTQLFITALTVPTPRGE